MRLSRESIHSGYPLRDNPSLGSVISDRDSQPIPPLFSPLPSQLYEMKEKKRKSVFNKKKLDRNRSIMNPVVPYTEEQLRKAVLSTSFNSTVTMNRPRARFYEADPQWKTRKNPLLMDAFSYCVNNELIVEIFFNTKYLRNHKAWTKNAWTCYHDGMSAKNMKHPIAKKFRVLTLFRFPGQCNNPQNQEYRVRYAPLNTTYTLSIEFLPDFTRQQFYLSACSMIENVPLGMVRMYINHYFFHGVQHFVFYINGHLYQWREWLSRYIDYGLVELVDFTFPNHKPFYEQDSMLTSCARRYRYNTQFMIFNDVDEFFHPMNSTWRIIDVLDLYNHTFPYADSYSVRIGQFNSIIGTEYMADL